MRARRPPLAEIDTQALWQAIRAGHWRQVLPWLLLLAGFCAVLAGMASFFWLTTRDTPIDRIPLLLALLAFCAFLYRRLSAQPGFALATLAVLLVTAAVIFVLWLLAFAAFGDNIWIGILGVMVECGLGIALGVLGINRLEPAA
jgi:hypothetical protein